MSKSAQRPTRLTLDSTRYVVDTDGRVYSVETDGYWSLVHDESIIARLRTRLQTRQRTNANRRAKHRAMTDLGLVRVRGANGGVYYE